MNLVAWNITTPNAAKPLRPERDRSNFFLEGDDWVQNLPRLVIIPKKDKSASKPRI